ncbi:MAG TPA: protein kinase [Polyangiaceae bacterium]|jgi:serine/threonine protein kinase|nr:protein kinase [Polyangiaceae bacterium]
MRPEPASHESATVGRFELLRPLGSGGAGTVFAAREIGTNERCAIKVLREREGTALYQFKQEFRVLADLSHPNVVRFGELFADDERWCLTMELVVGENFLDYVRPGAVADSPDGISATTTLATAALPPDSNPRPAIASGTRHRDERMHDGELDVSRLRHAARQLASGLIALHAAGLVHRDLKPYNVLVTPEGRLVILDFGLAVDSARVDTHGELAGTVAYMAPEQIEGATLTAAADWYAVGVMLHEALTGRLPNDGHPHRAIMLKRSTPPVFDSSVPSDLAALCTKLLDHNPVDRAGEVEIARHLGMDVLVERSRASFRSQLYFSRAVFVGRQAESKTLTSALARVRGGACRTVLVTGESGVGKSSLLRAFIDGLSTHTEAPLPLCGRCYDREMVPFRGVDLVVDALAKHLMATSDSGDRLFVPRHASLLSRMFPVLRAVPGFRSAAPSSLADVDPFEARRLGMAALKDLVGALSDERPLVLWIDDAQWLDDESAALLTELFRGVDAPRALLVFTARRLDRTANGPLSELFAASPDLTEIRLSPLPPADSEELAAALARWHGLLRPIDTTLVAVQSGGNPLFIHELVMHGVAARDSNSPLNIEHALGARIDGLDDACRRVLDTVSLSRAPLPNDVVRGAAELGLDAYSRALSALRAENLVTFQSSAPAAEVQTYHDRIRELVAARIAEPVRVAIHAALLRVFEATHTDALDALSFHSFEARKFPDAARYAQRAAQHAASKLAFEQAARFYELALRADGDSVERWALEAGLGHAFANLGRGVDSAEAYLRAATLSNGTRALELRRSAGEQLLRSGHVERGLEISSAVLRELGVAVPDSELSVALSLTKSLSWLKLFARRFRQAQHGTAGAEDRLRFDACQTLASGLSMVHQLRGTEFQARAVRLALDLGEPKSLVKATATLAASLSFARGPARRLAAELSMYVREIAAKSPSEENEAWVSLGTAASSIAIGDFRACEVSASRAEAVFRKCYTGVAWEVVTAQTFVLWSMAYQGKVRAIAERLPELVALARARNDHYALSTLVLGPLHIVGLALDDPARVARECLDAMPQWSSSLAYLPRLCAAYALAQAALYEGRVTDAHHQAELCAELLDGIEYVRVQIHHIDVLGLRARVELARAAESPDQRARCLLRVVGYARDLGEQNLGFATAMSELVSGGVAWQKDEPREAVVRFERAAQVYALDGMMLHAAAARYAAGCAGRDLERTVVAERELTELGVLDPVRMLRLWAPGVPPLRT